MSAVSFFEISGSQPGLADFYRSTFGWTLTTPAGPEYLMVEPGRDGALAGGIFDASAAWDDVDQATYAIFYIEVADVEATVAAAERAGAKVVVTPRPHGPTITAQLLDPSGNRIGVYQQA
jgi:hypothetical protein